MSYALITPVATKVTASTTPGTLTLDAPSRHLYLSNTDGTDDISVALNSVKSLYRLTWSAVAGDVAAVTVTESLNDRVAPVVTTATAGVTAVAEVQTITVDATGGTFAVTWSGQTTSALAFNISAANFTTALEALSNIAPGDVVVTGGPGDSGGTTPYTLTWNSLLGNVAAPTTDPALLTGGAGTAAVATITAGVAGSSELQTIDFTAQFGTFTITYSGQTTAPIAYNATAERVQEELEALSNIESGDVTVTLRHVAASEGVHIPALGRVLVQTPVTSISYISAAGTPVLAVQAL